MKIALILVGKTTGKHMEALINDYVERVGHYVGLEIKVIPELKNVRNVPVGQQKEKEAELIMQQLKAGDEIVLLDERGREFRSVEFADMLSHSFAQSAARRLVFIVGGPYGFSPRLYERGKSMMSLSRMTFSHQMIRLLFVEQLYRALTIIHGESYHHEG
ncbi:MAG: 23S rRNA (pseudouridine(1915)-N(3))-methyltransferase RlmH [Bacteroidaceae bacterium]|nr:23S rRNA (pseudouridine(1915)-N(3))-methyltransferase RlmH [Bacteroidaceae bacterium]